MDAFPCSSLVVNLPLSSISTLWYTKRSCLSLSLSVSHSHSPRLGVTAYLFACPFCFVFVLVRGEKEILFALRKPNSVLYQRWDVSASYAIH